jgi:hypothetical protein
MDLLWWLRLIVAVMGVGLAIYGIGILVTGRAPRRTQRAFRRLTDAGLYAVCSGTALVLLTLANVLIMRTQKLLAIMSLVVSMLLVGLAAIRYRPRQEKRRYGE